MMPTSARSSITSPPIIECDRTDCALAVTLARDVRGISIKLQREAFLRRSAAQKTVKQAKSRDPTANHSVFCGIPRMLI
jgi:hypothetical protein